MFWSFDDEEKLKELWPKGLSATQISKELKGNYTRSAILGKVHRLNLQRRLIPKERPIVSAKKKIPMPATKLEIRCQSPALPPETWAGFKACKAIDGDPCLPGWQMCGHKTLEGYEYCEYHYGIFVDKVATSHLKRLNFKS